MRRKRKITLEFDTRKMSRKSGNKSDWKEDTLGSGCYKRRMSSSNDECEKEREENGDVKRARHSFSAQTEQKCGIIKVEESSEESVVMQEALSPRFSGNRNPQRQSTSESPMYYRRQFAPATPSTSFYNTISVLSPASPYRKPRKGPMYKNFQLLGDSQFVRFSRQVLQEKFGGRSINYCVSGQTIQDLHKMLREKQYDLHQFVIVLIGTNDLKVQKCNADDMIKNYDDLLETLKSLTEKIILLTIPPVYLNADSINHWQAFEKFNKHILQQHDGEKVFVVDLGVHLVGYPENRGVQYYYEETYTLGRPDLLHLNVKGLRLLKFLLDLHHFDR